MWPGGGGREQDSNQRCFRSRSVDARATFCLRSLRAPRILLTLSLPLSSFSSSELLSFLRTPTCTGDGGFFEDVLSTSIDLGLYLGSPDEPVPPGFLRCNVLERPRVARWPSMVLEESSDDVVPRGLTLGRPDILLAGFGTAFASGDELLSLVSTPAAFSEGGCVVAGTRLPRLAAVSFVFFDCFSLSPCPSRSLCITSARALPIDVSPSVCRMDVLVVGRGRKTRPAVEVVTSAVVVVAVVGDIVV